MARKIAAYALFGLGFLTVTFFREYSGTVIPYPFLFWLLGILMFWGSWAILRQSSASQERQAADSMQNTIHDLKANGEQVLVNLSQCEVRQHHYFEEKEKYGTGSYFTTLSAERDIQALNALTDETGNTESVEVHQAVLIYSHEHNGAPEQFISRIIPLDRATLLFRLDAQKETTLYIDRHDRQRYYFDLEFLFS